MDEKLRSLLECYYKASIKRNAQRCEGEDYETGYDREVSFATVCENLIEVLIKDDTDFANAIAGWQAEGWNYDIQNPEELPDW